MSIRLIALWCGVATSTLMFYVMLAVTRAMLKLPRMVDAVRGINHPQEVRDGDA